MILFDQFGREIQVKKRPETREIAVTTIRDRWSDYPSAGLTPQRLSSIFKEADAGDVYRQAEMFEEMEEKDTHLFSELQTRKNAVQGLDYEIKAWDESAENKKISEFVTDCLFNLDAFDDALLDMLDAIGKGYSLNEILWDVSSGKAVISGFSWIHAKKAVFYERGATNMWAKSVEAPRILTEAEPRNGEIMPPFKLVYHRYKARSGYDTRAGVLRVCSWMYLFKNYGIKDWVAFSEVFGMPLRLGKYDTGASQGDKDALIAAIQSLGSDAAGIISKNTEIEFVETAKSTATDNIYQALAEFCDKQMSKAILGQTATTEGTPGKLGNETAQDKVRHDLIQADAESLGKTIRHQIIRPLVGYNCGWDKPLPWFNLLYEEPEDMAQLMTVYKGASEIGQPISAEHVSERFKIPMPKEGETVLLPRQIKSDAGNIPLAAKDRTILNNPFSEDEDVADFLVSQLAGLAMADTDQMMAQIKTLTDNAESLEDLRDGIVEIFKTMDPAELGDTIARALMLAEVSGRYEVADETGTLTPLETRLSLTGRAKKKSQIVAKLPPSLMAVFKLPFKEQETFFKKKLNIPTLRWTDLWKDQHAKAFSVAGAYKDDLLTDFRGAVDKAITEGTTLADFRKDFDAIVEKHGWNYNGSRNWRSEVIYSTNIRTAHAAGRWQQLNEPAVVKAYPYLEYRHGNSIHPRPQHLAWNGLTLPRDDPWWATHYPPNGWGCKCSVLASTRRDQQKASANGMAVAPPSPIDPKTGEPVGIDKGWGYNVGTAAQK